MRAKIVGQMPDLEADVFVHPTADVSADAQIGQGTKIWHQAQVREGAVIGKRCIVGKGAYVDKDVRVGDFCKLQNGVFVYHGFSLEKGVFLGPGVMLLNDKHPRAINPDGMPKSDEDWVVSEGVVEEGAAVGGGAVVLPGVRIGRMALVGAGSVVTRDVPERGIVAGNPARLRGFACDCGHVLDEQGNCPHCGRSFAVSSSLLGDRPDDDPSIGPGTGDGPDDRPHQSIGSRERD